MIKDTYIKMNEKVNPDPALIYRSLSAAEGTPRRTAKPAYKRPALICTILLVCLLLATPVLAAAGVDAAYEVLYTLSPSAAQYFKPVALSLPTTQLK